MKTTTECYFCEREVPKAATVSINHAEERHKLYEDVGDCCEECRGQVGLVEWGDMYLTPDSYCPGSTTCDACGAELSPDGGHSYDIDIGTFCESCAGECIDCGEVHLREWLATCRVCGDPLCTECLGVDEPPASAACASCADRSS